MREIAKQPTWEGVLKAKHKVDRVLKPTPLVRKEIRGQWCWLKLETLQPIGAFKIRGAWHRILSLTDKEQAKGIIAVSSGNHAQGVAWACRKLKIESVIVMPKDAPAAKIEATKRLGAKVVTYDREKQDRDKVASELLDQFGGTLVHPFGDPWVIEGQGTAGLEIIDQLGCEPSQIIVCCGGGGLTAGLCIACPTSSIIPVEPFGWDMVWQSIRAGKLVSASANMPNTICDALKPTTTKQLNLDILRKRCKVGITVTDDEVREAQRYAFLDLKLVVEPGGAAAIAAALAGKITLDEKTVLMVTGGNVDPDEFKKTISSQ
jgi:threonine dehydratase